MGRRPNRISPSAFRTISTSRSSRNRVRKNHRLGMRRSGHVLPVRKAAKFVIRIFSRKATRTTNIWHRRQRLSVTRSGWKRELSRPCQQDTRRALHVTRRTRVFCRHPRIVIPVISSNRRCRRQTSIRSLPRRWESSSVSSSTHGSAAIHRAHSGMSSSHTTTWAATRVTRSER